MEALEFSLRSCRRLVDLELPGCARQAELPSEDLQLPEERWLSCHLRTGGGGLRDDRDIWVIDDSQRVWLLREPLVLSWL